MAYENDLILVVIVLTLMQGPCSVRSANVALHAPHLSEFGRQRCA